MCDNIVITFGTFDLFHIGHLNLLRKAKSHCEKLIVGVSTDDLVAYKNKKAVIPFEERIEIISSIKYVDDVVEQKNLYKFKVWKNLKFNVMFVGDDWNGTPSWQEYEKKFKTVNVDILYFPYTKGTSSTLINQILTKRRNEK